MAAEFLDAAVKGDLNKMQQLVQRGTKLDVRGTYGETAFHCAAGRGHLRVVVKCTILHINHVGKNLHQRCAGPFFSSDYSF